MKIPTIHGLIDRRILINFTADPEVIRKIIPSPFRPKIYNDKAIVGICLIRLKNIKPKGFPNFDGMKLQAYKWKVKPLEVLKVKSSFFEDESTFPKGSIKFDNALLMTGIEHEWHNVKQKLKSTVS